MGVPFSPTMSLSKSFILLLNFMMAIPLGLPCICQVVIALSWVLLALLRFTLASLTLIIIHIAQACLMSSQAEHFYISFAAWFPIFHREGTFPSMSFPCTCFLALSIGMFHFLELVCSPLTLVSSYICNYKALLFFFNLFKISENFQKKSKNQKSGQEKMLSLARCVDERRSTLK